MNSNLKSISLTGFHLKYIAMLTMTIDHIGAVFLSSGTPLYALFRGIGRIAFPIFCFLLVEGFLHTSNRKSYFIRLFLFAFLSEIPFDMALFHFPEVTDPSVLFSHQNVYFTLAFAFLAMHLLDYDWFKGQSTGFVWLIIIGFLAEILNFDYGLTGVAVVIIFFLCKRFRPDIPPILTYILAVLPLFTPQSLSGMCVVFSIPLLLLYNGKKGSPLPFGISFPGAKYFFYLYYPLHLFVIGAIALTTV